ncbi:putative prolyl-tRNA synthetase associated domain-containing protein 1-like [Apostichopus japonicus]|uniref:PrdX deacylase domain-containing protein 1 n=1 Tax=Stichopus japonicus TaxID=307972 RepID=A0A2G8LCX4_STIJA|nr:putative prolyl-tRNA synthetase associated domain-containing protein 1-like [Apostichopus japonicus]
MDESKPDTSMSPGSGNMNLGNRKELEDFFEKLSINVVTVEHPEVFTVEAMLPYVQQLNGAVSKNLFLKDKKKKGLWLLTARHEITVNLADLAKQVGAPGGFRFADESLLKEALGVGQGCVTPFAVFNDKEQKVKLLVDSDFVNGGHERIYGHPMVNSATIGITPEDLMKFWEATGHKPILVNL